jgi:hypothetical protein
MAAAVGIPEAAKAPASGSGSGSARFDGAGREADPEPTRRELFVIFRNFAFEGSHPENHKRRGKVSFGSCHGRYGRYDYRADLDYRAHRDIISIVTSPKRGLRLVRPEHGSAVPSLWDFCAWLLSREDS